MNRNAVEMLSIINPDNDESPRWPLLAGGVAAVGALYWLMKRRQQTGIPDAAANGVSGLYGEIAKSSTAQFVTAAGMGLGLLLLSKSYWGDSGAGSAPPGLRKNPKSRHTYFVRVPRDGITYPIDPKTRKTRSKGYSLSSAFAFARIGSQKGSPREIRRGSPRGKLIRRYVGGKRSFPRDAAEAKRRGLLPVEMPSNGGTATRRRRAS